MPTTVCRIHLGELQDWVNHCVQDSPWRAIGLGKPQDAGFTLEIYRIMSTTMCKLYLGLGDLSDWVNHSMLQDQMNHGMQDLP